MVITLIWDWRLLLGNPGSATDLNVIQSKGDITRDTAMLVFLHFSLFLQWSEECAVFFRYLQALSDERDDGSTHSSERPVQVEVHKTNDPVQHLFKQRSFKINS